MIEKIKKSIVLICQTFACCWACYGRTDLPLDIDVKSSSDHISRSLGEVLQNNCNPEIHETENPCLETCSVITNVSCVFAVASVIYAILKVFMRC